MNPSMRNMLFAEFGKLCDKQGWKRNDDTRARVTYAALGKHKSWSNLTKSDADRIKRKIIELADPENLGVQLDALEYEKGNDPGELQRHTWAIARYIGAFGIVFGSEMQGESYALKILRDLHDQSDLEGLGFNDLQNYKWRLENALSKIITAIKKGEREGALLLPHDRSNKDQIAALFHAQDNPTPAVDGITDDNIPF